MELPQKSYAHLVRSYVGGLAHVHTRLSNHPGHHESDLTIESLVAMLRKNHQWSPGRAPLEYILFNEHSSNPDQPKTLGWLSLRAWQLRRRRPASEGGIPLFYGLEVSLLAGGETDLVPRLDDGRVVVIASRHRLPADAERDSGAIMELFERACFNRCVNVIGHPARNIEDLAAVNWARVFEFAAESGTAIEVNVNTFPRAETEGARMQFWTKWMELLGQSEAQVFMGMDLHNTIQVRRLSEQWALLEDTGRFNSLRECVRLMAGSGIGPERVVNRNMAALREWMALDKMR